jgi:membrane fusion protein, multidrug efflux system
MNEARQLSQTLTSDELQMNKVNKWVTPITISVTSALLIGIVGFAYWLGTRQLANSSTQSGSPPTAAANSKAAGGPPPTAVDAATVSLAPFAKTISAVGSLRSDEAVIIRPEVSGRIAEIGFREGQRVVKGSVILKLDQAVQRAEMQQADANLSLSKSRIERSRDLHAKGFISSQALDDAESAYKVAKATTDLAGARLTKLEIKAPFSGIVGLRSVSVGDYVREGQDIVNLEEIDPLKVDFRVPEIFLRQISVGQTLQVNLDANPGETFTGRVLAINPLLDANGRAVVIRAVVNNNNAKLRPGMFARVKLITSESQESLTIPEQALIPVGDEFFVFRITDGRVARIKIEIGQRVTGSVEVLKGLNKDDMVVTAGQPKIRDGGQIKLATLDGKPVAVAPPPASVATPAPAKKS